MLNCQKVMTILVENVANRTFGGTGLGLLFLAAVRMAAWAGRTDMSFPAARRRGGEEYGDPRGPAMVEAGCGRRRRQALHS